MVTALFSAVRFVIWLRLTRYCFLFHRILSTVLHQRPNMCDKRRQENWTEHRIEFDSYAHWASGVRIKKNKKSKVEKRDYWRRHKTTRLTSGNMMAGRMKTFSPCLVAVLMMKSEYIIVLILSRVFYIFLVLHAHAYTIRNPKPWSLCIIIILLTVENDFSHDFVFFFFIAQ